MAILVTVGAGYIGSHTSVELLNAGYEIVIIDNFINREALNRIKKITGRDFKSYNVDLLDMNKVNQVFIENRIEAVIHFAGIKAVGESVNVPLSYYDNNITSTIILCEIMKRHNVKKMVFSSSATVYGIPDKVPITEDSQLYTINPYGRAKIMIEEILRDLYLADSSWSIALLRYFNPAGAHKSGLIGEDPSGIPYNIMQNITQVAAGKLKELNVLGNSYPTHDGTKVRDYIHVVDLAAGHLRALEKVSAETGIEAYNLGTGKGFSVLEMVTAFEKVSGVKIPFKFLDPRPGDAAICYVDPSKARKELGWLAERGLEEMISDSWRWQSMNPNGYENQIDAELKNPHFSKSEDFLVGT